MIEKSNFSTFHRGLKYFMFVSCCSLVLGWYSCNKSHGIKIDPDNSKNFEETHYLKKTSTKVMRLDSLSTFINTAMLHYFTVDGIPYLAALNLLTPSIDIYDYQVGELKYRVPLHTEGPNGIGKINLTLTFYVVDFNKIIIFQNYTKNIYVMNIEGSVSRSISLEDEFDKRAINFANENAGVPILFDQYLYVSTLPTYSDKKALASITSKIRIDTSNLDIEYMYPYSSIYDQYFWGNSTSFQYYSSITKTSNNEILVSFPKDPQVYRVCDEQLCPIGVLGSYEFDRLIPYSSDSLKDLFEKMDSGMYPFNEDWDQKNSMTNSEFANIFCEQSTGNIVRLAYLRVSEEDYNRGYAVPDLSVIIADAGLKKVGEKRLRAKDYYSSIYFFTPEGFHILNRASTDSEAIFDVYSTAPME